MKIAIKQYIAIESIGLWVWHEAKVSIFFFGLFVSEVVITTPDDVAVKCPHKINGPNWIPFKNNCYSFQLAVNRWDQVDRNDVHETCRRLGGSSTEVSRAV